MKSIVYIVILAMTLLMIPLGKADPIITATPSENHHIPELLPGNSTGSQPYMAGWMDTGGTRFGVSQTRITVSFPNTDPSVIQTDNWIGGGMFVGGYDEEVGAQDYGYYATLTLDHEGNIQLNVGVYQVCEGFPYNIWGDPPQCPGFDPTSKLLFATSIQLSGFSRSEPVTLTARWEDTPSPGWLYWDYTVYGTTYTAASANMTLLAPTAHHGFRVGLYDLWLLGPSYYKLAYFFQFGIYSSYNIGQSGWKVKLEYPQYYKNGWNHVAKAKSIGGAEAYFDEVWRWGGENYEGVNAYYRENDASLGRYKIIFYYSGSTLGDHTLLWKPPPPTGGGGGGCPYVSTWNGTHYVLDNNLIPAAEHSNGTDVIDYYKLQQPLAFDEGRYSLLISDVDKHSYIDKVQLLAVDHDLAFNIAVTSHGEILTYRNPTPPQTAITKDDYDVTNLIEETDDLYYEGWPDDYLTIDFGQLDITEGAKLLVQADPLCEPVPCKLSIHVQVLKPHGWTDVATFIPRTYWSTDIVDLSAHLPDINGELKVRLYLTGNHRIDYIGLDTTKQGEFETRYANLVSAVHSNGTDMKEALMNSDNQYAELLPSQQITLKFTLPQNTKDTRNFIIKTEGHYYPIQT